MAEYIKRGDVLKIMKDVWSLMPGDDAMQEAINCITYLHAADVVERKRGEWIRVTEELGESWMCSECMEEFIPHDGMEEFASYAHFCPNCGARMGGDDDS